MQTVLMNRLSWPEYRSRTLDGGAPVLLPVGATEQHGPHLPLGTDALLASAVAEGVAQKVGGIVAPALAYGFKSQPKCGGGQHFTGTTSLDAATLVATVHDTVREFHRHGLRKLIVVNDDDLTYCSLRLDPESLQTALTRIADIADPLPRTLAWSAAWEMTREAELKARDFVALVSGGVDAETEVGVAQRLLLQAQTALTSYADPTWASTRGWPAFADRLLELARGAEPGSDHQLAYVNALCNSVLSHHHATALADLLDRDPADLGLAGLEVDTDLRWRIVAAIFWRDSPYLWSHCSSSSLADSS